MADTKNASLPGYSPDMDGKEHEQTYLGFVHFAVVMSLFSLGWVVFLAVGGLKHAWPSAWFGLFLVHVAAAVSLFTPIKSWKPGAAALGLLLLMLVLY